MTFRVHCLSLAPRHRQTTVYKESKESIPWNRCRARIFKLLRSQRIDSKEPTPPGCVGWGGTTTLLILGSSPHWLLKNSSTGVHKFITPVVYMARDVMMLTRATSISRATGRRGLENRDFLGPEICMVAFVGTGSLVANTGKTSTYHRERERKDCVSRGGWLWNAEPITTHKKKDNLYFSVVPCCTQKAGRHQIVETIG